jgi:fatty acid desaturase
VKLPTSRGALFWLYERALPGLDRERIWRGLDLDDPRPGEATLEARIAAGLRPHARGLATTTLAFFTLAVAGVYGAGPRLAALLPGPVAWLLPLAAGVLVHGLFVLVVHEATHGNLYGHPADGWIGNAALGALLLPFAAESYQHVHRRHHKLAVRQGDPYWTPFRQRLFARSRLLYALYELVPIVNNLDRLERTGGRDRRKVALAWALALLVLAGLRPGAGYVLAVMVGLNATNAVRIWTEHFGLWQGRVSNVYWCPLGFGIGNHRLHHEDPRLPALALALGLAVRRKDASMLAAPLHLLFTPGYGPFRAAQPDFDGSNV